MRPLWQAKGQRLIPKAGNNCTAYVAPKILKTKASYFTMRLKVFFFPNEGIAQYVRANQSGYVDRVLALPSGGSQFEPRS